MNDLFVAIGFGLVTASVLLLSTVALSLQFSVTDIPNFAHGDIMTAGAYAAYVALKYTHNVLLAGLFSCVVGGLLALLLNAMVLQPFARRGAARLVLFILTIACGLILENVFLLIFGTDVTAYPLSVGIAHQVGPFLLTDSSLAVIGVAVVSMLAIHLMLRYTKFGKAQRAVADSPMLARVTGINAPRVISYTWGLAGAMTGLSGFVLGISVGGSNPYLGFEFLLVVFAAAIVGGLGKAYGAMGGALIIGLATEVAARYLPAEYKLVVAFLFLIAVLLVRPNGLFRAAVARA